MDVFELALWCHACGTTLEAFVQRLDERIRSNQLPGLLGEEGQGADEAKESARMAANLLEQSVDDPILRRSGEAELGMRPAIPGLTLHRLSRKKHRPEVMD